MEKFQKPYSQLWLSGRWQQLRRRAFTACQQVKPFHKSVLALNSHGFEKTHVHLSVLASVDAARTLCFCAGLHPRTAVVIDSHDRVHSTSVAVPLTVQLPPAIGLTVFVMPPSLPIAAHTAHTKTAPLVALGQSWGLHQRFQAGSAGFHTAQPTASAAIGRFSFNLSYCTDQLRSSLTS